MNRRWQAAVAHLALPVVISAAIARAIYWIEAGGSPLLAFVLAQLASPFRWSGIERQTV